MLVSLVLSWLARQPRFTWSPALDLSNNEVRSTLLPGGQI